MKHWYDSIRHIVLFLFCFLLPTQLGKHFFFDFSYVNGIRIDYLAPTLHVTDILAILLILLYIHPVLSFLKQKPLIFIGVLSLITIAFSQSPWLGLYRYIKGVEWACVFAVFSSFRSKNNPVFNWVLIAFFCGILFELTNSLLQLTYKQSVQGFFYWFGERRLSLTTPDVAIATMGGPLFLRPYGTFSHPNSLGGFYLLTYFFILMFPGFRQLPRIRSVSIFLAMLLVFISFSKIVIGVFALLNLCLFAEVIAKGKCKFCGISRTVTLIVLAVIFSFSHGDPYTVEKRITLVDNAFDIIFHHPIFGVGIGNYLLEQSKYVNTYSGFFLQPVHNILLLFFSEHGIVIGGMILALLYKPVLSLVTNRAFQFCFAVVLLTGMIDHYWLTLQQNFLITAVVFSLIYAERTDKIDPLGN